MTLIRIASVAPPLDRSPIRDSAAALVRRAAAVGLLGDRDSIRSLDLELLRSIAHEAAAEGVGQTAALALLGDDPRFEQLAGAIRQLDEALSESPLPARELGELLRIFDLGDLADLVGSSAVSLRRYASRARTMPDQLAARVHWLALVVSDLAGAYNEFGIRRWFERPRAQLEAQAPKDLLRGEWDPQSRPVEEVRRLAAALVGAGAGT